VALLVGQKTKINVLTGQGRKIDERLFVHIWVNDQRVVLSGTKNLSNGCHRVKGVTSRNESSLCRSGCERLCSD
jgi:hypothetical protein